MADLVGALARVFGTAFSNLSAEFFDAMMKFAKTSRPSSDRAMAIGCFAEMLQFMGASGAPHVAAVIPVVEAGLHDPSPAVRRNSAFAVGILASAAPTAVAPHYPAFLAGLRPLFDLTHESDLALKDNAASAVARLVLAAPGAVPLSQVLPVFLDALPLKADLIENENVYTCLAFLYEARHPDLLALFPKAALAAAHAFTVSPPS